MHVRGAHTCAWVGVDGYSYKETCCLGADYHLALMQTMLLARARAHVLVCLSMCMCFTGCLAWCCSFLLNSTLKPFSASLGKDSPDLGMKMGGSPRGEDGQPEKAQGDVTF